MGSSLSTLKQFEKQREFLFEVAERNRKILKNPAKHPGIADLPFLGSVSSRGGREMTQSLPPLTRRVGQRSWDVVVTASEVSDGGEIGPSIRAIFESGGNFLSIRSRTIDFEKLTYAKRNLEFRHTVLDGSKLTRREVYESLARSISHFDVSHIFSVPSGIEEIETTLALATLTGSPLAVWVTCEQIFEDSESILRGKMGDLVAMADMVWAISPELRARCEKEYSVKTWLLPPILNQSDINRKWIWDSVWRGEPADPRFEEGPLT